MSREREEWIRVSVSALEADVAYFDARLALIGSRPESYYQEAQVKAYRELERVLSDMLNSLNNRSHEAGEIEVVELGGDN